MKNKQGTKIVCALNEHGTIGVRVKGDAIKFVRFTYRPVDNTVIVCVNNQPKLERVTYNKFLELANAFGDKVSHLVA